MCPVYNPARKECRVTPWDSSALRDESEIKHKCTDSYEYKRCKNYEAYVQRVYKIER